LDVLAVPSKTTAHWKEQFGRVLIEAMAVELPVVAYASGEIPHVVGDAGVLLPEGDIQGLRDALSGLVEDAEAAARYRTQGRQRVLSHFSQERVARLLMDVYNSFK
jgi:glycosyltransferase involved in cell wall biosynthesis